MQHNRLIQIFFDTHCAHDADENLNMMLQCWLCNDNEWNRSNMEIANMTFFVNGLITLTRNIEPQRESLPVADQFYSIYDQESLETRLNSLLSEWICPFDNCIKPIEAANMVDFVYCAIKFLIELEGGVLCA